MITPALIFTYLFEVCDPASSRARRIGQGESPGTHHSVERLAGSSPRFELDSGWLMLYPTDGWARSFPSRWFSDQPKPPAMDQNACLADMKAQFDLRSQIQKESWKEAAEKVSLKENFSEFMKEENKAYKRALQQHGLERNVKSFSLFVGDALEHGLRVGDKLRYLRDGNADFHYSVERDGEVVFSAGTVNGSDPGGPMATWQEYDRHPNRNVAALKEKHPNQNIAEWIHVQKPYVTARINEQHFNLLDGQEACIGPYYVFLARSNKKVPTGAFEFWPRAVHAGGRLDVVSKEQIVDAAQKLTRPQVRIL